MKTHLIIKEEYLPQFTQLLKQHKPEEIIKFCKETYNLDTTQRYIKCLYTKFVINSEDTQSFFLNLRTHLRNLKYPVNYNSLYPEDLTLQDVENYKNKMKDYNFPNTLCEDILNYFSK